jgi:dolichol-phosphate mannosyltransferase
MNTEKPVRRLPAFCAVGALGIAVQLGVLHFLVNCLRIHYLAATGIAVEAAVLHNFVWHKRWTWANRNITGLNETLKRLALFHLTNGIVSIAGNLLWMRFLVGTMGWNYLPANITTIAAGALLNFWAGDRIVFHAGNGEET